jgi:hypothetical protein
MNDSSPAFNFVQKKNKRKIVGLEINRIDYTDLCLIRRREQYHVIGGQCTGRGSVYYGHG